MSGHGSKDTHSCLPPPHPPQKPIPAPPPTVGHAGLGHSPIHVRPDHLSGGLIHKCHPRGSGHHPSEPSKADATPP